MKKIIRISTNRSGRPVTRRSIQRIHSAQVSQRWPRRPKRAAVLTLENSDEKGCWLTVIRTPFKCFSLFFSLNMTQYFYMMNVSAARGVASSCHSMTIPSALLDVINSKKSIFSCF